MRPTRPPWSGLKRAFRLPSTDSRLRADVDAELEFHIQGRTEELMAQGMSKDDAQREARRRFGDYRRVEAEVARVDRGTLRKRTLRDRLDALWADLRYTLRSLARQPIFSLVVVATFTLGIGPTAAIYHTLDRAVLHPLPYPEADRIVYLGWKWAKSSNADALSARKFEFWHDQSRVFDAVGTLRAFDAVAANAHDGSGSGVLVHGSRISSDFLRVIGMRPELGRAFLPGEFAVGAEPVVILSHALWVARFGGDRAILGRTIQLDDHPYTVVGVMPESFEVAEESGSTELLLPLAFTADRLNDHGGNYMAIGRLRDGVTARQIDDDMKSVFARYRATYPELIEPDDRGVVLVSYQSFFVGDLAGQLWVLLGATVFVLLLACANVANLVLGRALARQREFAVRTALGAGRARIVRQVMLEMGVLGLASAVCAIGVSLASVRGVVSLAHGALLRDSQLRLDPRVVVYTTLVALAASLIVGITVALAATRVDLTKGLAGSARSAGLGSRQRGLRNTLVAAESTLAMVLLAGAGLLIASFARVINVDAGFKRTGVFTSTISHVPKDYSNTQSVWRFEQRVLAELRATPGIASAGAASTLPLVRGMNIPITIEGNDPNTDDGTEGAAEWRSMTPSYLQTFGIKLIAGRDITDADNAAAPPVVIVSQSLAARYWPGQNAIGKRIFIGRYKGKPIAPEADEPAREVIGVVPDLRDMSLEAKRMRHTLWVPQAQLRPSFVPIPSFAVQATDAHVAATALRRAIADADPRMGVPEVSSMNDIVSRSLSWRRFGTVLMAAFALLALTLTCVGIYGVASYSVSQRVQEIGIRMALGAEPRRVVTLIVGQGVRPAVIGLVVGLALSLALSRVIAKMLFNVSPHDPLSLGAVAVLLAVVAVVASYVPARRAARVNPIAALRTE